MEDIFNVSTFVKYLTAYVRLAVYINKGTDQDELLERCVAFYNKYKRIESMTEMKPEHENTVKKCLKRFNLVLKVNKNGSPIDVNLRQNQVQILDLKAHASIYQDDLQQMVEYAGTSSINILTGVPLSFVLKPGKYLELMWHYTKVVFFITQLILSKAVTNDKSATAQRKKTLFAEAAEHIGTDQHC